jgi:hypothetical protein
MTHPSIFYLNYFCTTIAWKLPDVMTVLVIGHASGVRCDNAA